MNTKLELIREYFNNVSKANKELTKKEAFKDLLNRMYVDDDEIIEIINKITLGAEKTIFNIPRKEKLHRGSADTLYNNIIIEFENDLSKTLIHAKEQLAGYLLGQLRSGLGYNFILIASDFINWKVFCPKVELLDKLETLEEHQLELEEIETSSFKVTEKNFEDFYYWLDRFLFKEEKQKATLLKIEEAFGYQSHIFIESYRELHSWYKEAKRYGTVQVSYEQWDKFLSIAYGKFEANERIFLIHTYLSIFAKMLAYTIVSNDDFLNDDKLKGILSGQIFYKYNISNFVDNDFFHWVNGEKDFYALKKVFRLIAQEIATFDYENVQEDILKGVYQELIDLDTRHALGEYYTPDWLCERILNEFDLQPLQKILDPSCGSGSFLLASIKRLQFLNPDLSAEDINNQIYGIDIHPLSVQIAKTTILLALGKNITKAKKPVHINVILANTLLAPEGVSNFFGSDFNMNIDGDVYKLNTQILDDDFVFESVLGICESLANDTFGKKTIDIDIFENVIKRKLPKANLIKTSLVSFFEIYKGLKKVKESGRDSIWKFIISNLYKPYFLSKRFDYIIGNPPWFTYSSISSGNYQEILDNLATLHKVKPAKIANYPHLEIASIFQAYCSSYFLKESGKMALVLPRSFFSADHHDNTRSGEANGFSITNIWDLKDVAPLFRIPSCVLFSVRKHDKQSKKLHYPATTFSGKLDNHNCHYNYAKNLLTENSITLNYIKRGSSSAFSTQSKSNTKANYYKSKFKQGATIVPRAFYFIELNQETPPDFENRTINIKTADSIGTDAKPPWKGLYFENKIESNFIFRTALSKSILPFALYEPDLITLPVIIEKEHDDLKKIKLLNSSELLEEGFIDASRWYANAENIWDLHKTEKNGKITAENYLNWRNKLTDQNLNTRYLVLYNGRGSNASSCVVDRTKIDFEIFIDHALYYFSLNSIEEAHYLNSILNSAIPNKLMKDFQSTGLFGTRNIHRKILDISFSLFDTRNEFHIRLNELSKICSGKVDEYLLNNIPEYQLTAYHLGRLRVEIKKHLNEEIKEIDKIVEQLIK